MSNNRNLRLALLVGVIVLAITGYVAGSGMETYATFWALIPPIVAISLALITKEVYSSLFIGIIVGGILSSSGSMSVAMDHIVSDGLVGAVTETAGIFLFLVILGILVALINKSGGTAAFGRWAHARIHSRRGAKLTTFLLGILIFIDDYFNCLTVGTVMQPITDSHKISRVKLAYIIDSTAAPICMIAPVSSWAAAVSGYAEGTGLSGIELFVRAIPFNFYSLLTLLFVFTIVMFNFDYGPMAEFEHRARTTGDLSISKKDQITADSGNDNGIVLDLVLPVIVLIVFSVVGLLHSGGYFDPSDVFYRDIIGAFGNTDATIGLPWGSMITLIFAMVYFLARRVITFDQAMNSIIEGFNAMVPAITILTMATSLKIISNDLLGSAEFVGGVMTGVAPGLANFLPAVIFVVAIFLSFATGTSWGTFGILIPIIVSMFDINDPLFIIGISACLAGSVCGDHCSPISDTTIMSSAGAGCHHVDHVTTQLPYGLTVAAISIVSFIIAGFTHSAVLSLGVGVVLVIGTLFIMRSRHKDITE